MEEEEGEEFTSMAMDSSSPTDLPFIKANLTLSKFFNVSVPIEDKFNFRWHLDKNNLTEQVSFELKSSTSANCQTCFSGESTWSSATNPSVHQLCPLSLQPRLCNVLGEATIFFDKIPFLHPPPQITYITFFNSRLVGALATKLANRFLHLFVKGGYVKVGWCWYHDKSLCYLTERSYPSPWAIFGSDRSSLH